MARAALLLLWPLSAKSTWGTRCYGTGNYGGTGGAGGARPPPAVAAMRLTQVDMNGRTACGLDAESRVVCWGRTDDGGGGVYKYAVLPEPATTFDVGHWRVCLALVSSGVKCYKADKDNQEYGSGTELFLNGTQVASISIQDRYNPNFICILDTEGWPSCWNVAFTVRKEVPRVWGTKIKTTRSLPCIVSGSPGLLQCFSQPGDRIPAGLDEINNTVVYDMDRWGNEFICVVAEDGTIKCIGTTMYDGGSPVEADNGKAPFSRVVVGSTMACGLTVADQEVACWGHRSAAIPTIYGASFIGAGGATMCVSGDLTEPALPNGNRCVGYPGGSRDNLDVATDRGLDIPAAVENMDLHQVDRNGKVACGLNAESRVVCWGRNNDAVLSYFALPGKVRTFCVDFETVCLALETSGVMCYDTDGSMEPTLSSELLLNGTQVASLSVYTSYDWHLCILDLDGKASCIFLANAEVIDPFSGRKYRQITANNNLQAPDLSAWAPAKKIVTNDEILCTHDGAVGQLNCRGIGGTFRRRRRRRRDAGNMNNIKSIVHDVDMFGRTGVCVLEGVNRTISCYGKMMKGDGWGTITVDNSKAPYSKMAMGANLVCGVSQADSTLACSGYVNDIAVIPDLGQVSELGAGGRGICAYVGFRTTTTTISSTTTTSATTTSSTSHSSTATTVTRTATSTTSTVSSTTSTASSTTTVSSTSTSSSATVTRTSTASTRTSTTTMTSTTASSTTSKSSTSSTATETMTVTSTQTTTTFTRTTTSFTPTTTTATQTTTTLTGTVTTFTGTTTTATGTTSTFTGTTTTLTRTTTTVTRTATTHTRTTTSLTQTTTILTQTITTVTVTSTTFTWTTTSYTRSTLTTTVTSITSTATSMSSTKTSSTTSSVTSRTLTSTGTTTTHTWTTTTDTRTVTSTRTTTTPTTSTTTQTITTVTRTTTTSTHTTISVTQTTVTLTGTTATPTTTGSTTTGHGITLVIRIRGLKCQDLMAIAQLAAAIVDAIEGSIFTRLEFKGVTRKHMKSRLRCLARIAKRLGRQLQEEDGVEIETFVEGGGPSHEG